MGEFVRFDFKGKTLRPRMSINASYIGLNRAAVEKFGIAKYKAVVLFFDEQDRRIGVLLTNNDSESGSRVVRVHKSGSATIACRNFVERYSLFNAVEGINRYTCKFEAEKNMVIADLQEKRSSGL